MESSNEISKRHSSWKKIDRTLTAYIPLDDAEKKVQDRDERKPVSIVIPYSFATLETLLTYFSAAFLEYPIFKYSGHGPEDRVGAILLEKVIEMQSRRAKMALALHTAFRDGWAYGLGAVAPYWDKVWGKKTVVEDATFFSALFAKMMSSGQKRVTKDVVLYEGNYLRNIDPYCILPDPNVPIHEVQKGESFGWIDTSNYLAILSEEQSDPQNCFNARYLAGYRGASGNSIYNKAKSSSGREERFGVGTQSAASSTSPIDKVYLYVNLIPKDWGLGSQEYPEKWLFCVAADKIILQARPLGLNHGMFPVATCSPDYDGYSVSPVSRLELIGGLQTTLDWLVNCYDDQTEVLTDRGWVLLSETIDSDRVATVDPVTRGFWFEQPKQWFEYDYDGWMLNFKSSRMDICVTPHHNMFARRRYKGSWDFIPAINLALDAKSEYKTIGNLNWNGVEPNAVEFAAEQPKRDRGHEVKYKKARIEPLVLAGFLGWFLSEGSISKGKVSGSYAISIKQAKRENYADIDGIMSAMPFHVTKTWDDKKDATQWTITDKRLYMWLKDNCYSSEGTTSEFKKVPFFVKAWDTYYLELLFERAILGDGYWIKGRDNLAQYGSKSKQLVDDLQEVALRLGYFSHTKLSTTPAGLPFYVLNISTSETNPTITTRNCYKTQYKGKVYCFENSTHLTVTRRNGKVAIQGQSHIQNVRKSINDMLVVDPSLVNINDLLDPAPGKLIRMRRAAWGRGVQNAVSQLAVNDITRSHIQDSAYITELIKTCSGSVDSVMGLARTGSERVSADESRGTRMAALSRLTKAAKVVSLQMMQDLSYMLASHTQQLMTRQVYVEATGRWEEELRSQYPDQSRINVDPLKLSIDYDIVEGDGSLPTGENADVMTTLFQSIVSQPMLSQQFDIVRIFQRICMMMGVKDVNEFKLRQQQGTLPNAAAITMPDQVVESEAQKGNLVPIE